MKKINLSNPDKRLRKYIMNHGYSYELVYQDDRGHGLPNPNFMGNDCFALKSVKSLKLVGSRQPKI